MNWKAVLILVFLTVVVVALTLYYVNRELGLENTGGEQPSQRAMLLVEDVSLSNDTLTVKIRNVGSDTGCVDVVYILDSKGDLVCELKLPVGPVCLGGSEYRTVNFSLVQCDLDVNETYYVVVNKSAPLSEAGSFKYVRRVVGWLPENYSAPPVAILIEVGACKLEHVRAGEEVARQLVDLALPYSVAYYPTNAKPELLGWILEDADAVISFTYSHVLPDEIVKAEVLAAQEFLSGKYENTLAGVVDAPWGEIDDRVLKALKQSGIEYVIARHGGSTRFLNCGGVIVVQASRYPSVNPIEFILEGKPTIITVALEGIGESEETLQGFLELILELSEMAEQGKARICRLADFIAEADGYAVEVDSFNQTVLRLVSGSEEKWEIYRVLLGEASYRLSRLSGENWSRFAEEVSGVVDTEAFWVDHTVSGGELEDYYERQERAIRRLEEVLKELRSVVKDFACYYLTEVNPENIIGRNFRILVLEFEEGLSSKDVEMLKKQSELVLAYVNFGYAEQRRITGLEYGGRTGFTKRRSTRASTSSNTGTRGGMR